MLHGVRLPREEILVRYRVSERLAARVGALLGRGVTVTGAVLESAAPGSPVEALLLRPAVLDRAFRLKTSDVAPRSKAKTGKGRKRAHAAAGAPALAVAETPEGCVIALVEEVEAEHVWESKSPASEVQSPGSEGQGLRSPVRSRRAARGRASPAVGDIVGPSAAIPLAAPPSLDALREAVLGAPAGEPREVALERFAGAAREGDAGAVGRAVAFLREMDDAPAAADEGRNGRDLPVPGAAGRAPPAFAEATAGPPKPDAGEGGKVAPTRDAAVVRALGVALSGPGAPPELVASAAADFRGRLLRAEHPEAAACALGCVAAGPVATPLLKSDALGLMLDFLDRASTDGSARVRETDGARVLELADDTGRQIDYTRELIRAAERILRGAGVAPGLRERATRRLVAKWARVAEYAEVWAPGNVADLAEALAAVAASPETPAGLRVEVIGALRGPARSIPVIRALGAACAGPYDDDAFAACCRDVAGRLLAMLRQRDYAGAEDQQTLLEAIGRIVGHPRLAPDPAESEAVRARLVEALVDGAGRGHRTAREALAALAESPNVSGTLRRTIRQSAIRNPQSTITGT